jgi:hypothetical protein
MSNDLLYCNYLLIFCEQRNGASTTTYSACEDKNDIKNCIHDYWRNICIEFGYEKPINLESIAFSYKGEITHLPRIYRKSEPKLWPVVTVQIACKTSIGEWVIE